MNTSESPVATDARLLPVAGVPSGQAGLRRLLVIAVVLLVVGLIVFALFTGLSAFAADPMTGT